MEKGHSFECNTTQRLKAVSEVGPGDVYGVLSDFKLSAPAEGFFFSSRVLRQMFAKYYFNNPTYVTQSNPRGPLVSVSSGLGRNRKLLPQFRVSVFRLVAMVRAYGAPARLADSTSWISCFATTRWSVVTLDPGKKQTNNPFY